MNGWSHPPLEVLPAPEPTGPPAHPRHRPAAADFAGENRTAELVAAIAEGESELEAGQGIPAQEVEAEFLSRS
ncbi:MAG: hypothetical protein ACRDTE_28985 [Pseudonocardiaceae bacterium]